MKWCLVLLVLAGVSRADNTLNASEYSIFACPKLKSQEEIDLDKVSATDTRFARWTDGPAALRNRAAKLTIQRDRRSRMATGQTRRLISEFFGRLTARSYEFPATSP